MLGNGCGHIGADARQGVIGIIDADRFTLGGKKPATRKTHHAIPDHRNSTGRKLQSHHLLPTGEAVYAGGLAEFGWNRAQGLVIAKDQVPDLASDDGKHGRRFQPQQTSWEQGYEKGHDHRQKAQHRHRLEHIDQGQKQPFGYRRTGRQGAHSHRNR